MNEFQAYFILGIQHITDFQAYDHMLFVCTLCACYHWTSWREILILVTAFTIGHSLTLSLAALNVISVNSTLIELAIPLTIMLTAINNLLSNQEKKNRKLGYLLAIFFGLIHGMGFSNYLKSVLMGKSSVLQPLFAFNVGIEVGQIMIIAIFLFIFIVLEKIFKFKLDAWKIFWSGLGFGIAGILFLELLLQ